MKRPLNPTSRRKRPCRMPRIAAAILLTALTAIAAPKARADEGMWLPSLIGERIDDMRAKGFRLTAEDIYSVNEASMKDAVVLFNGGCTGELISPEGLLVTNHHCGYGRHTGPFDRRTRLPDPRILGARPLGRAAATRGCGCGGWCAWKR